jgi:hypothetical protein
MIRWVRSLKRPTPTIKIPPTDEEVTVAGTNVPNIAGYPQLVSKAEGVSAPGERVQTAAGALEEAG